VASRFLAMAYERSDQFSPSLSHLRPSRNPVCSSQLSGLGMLESHCTWGFGSSCLETQCANHYTTGILCRKDEREFTGTIYHKVSRRLETAIQMEWTAGSNDTKFAIAAKYCPDMDTTLRVLYCLLYCKTICM